MSEWQTETTTTGIDLLKFEAMDRISVKMHELADLGEHNGLTKKAKKKINKALRSLYDAYQLQSDVVHLWVDDTNSEVKDNV